ncbi:MAG: ABC transporter permease [Bacteroidota bacterium]
MFKELKIVINQVTESILFAFGALRGNKVRTLLSTLGITIGIFSIITVLALVDSLERSVKKSIDSLGKDAIIIDKWSWDFSGEYKWWKYANRPSPSIYELDAIKEKSTLADAACYVTSLNVNVEQGINSASGVTLNAVTYDYYHVKNFNFMEGRFFTEHEVKNGTAVAVIGYELAQNLFGGKVAIEKEITVKKKKYMVVGVIEKQGESLFGNQFDNLVIVPLKCAAQHIRLNSNRNTATIEVKARAGVSPDRLEEELRGIMRAQRKLRPGQEANFALNKTSLFDEPLKQTFKVITIAGWVIGGFAMLVGAFGIANIMFVSVKERTNQIGIKKSLGAKNYFILIEFLVEAIVLCLAGGVAGLLLVAGITQLVQLALGLEVVLSFSNISIGFGTSVAVGVLAGLIPAVTASRLDPVVAIRAK